MSVTSDVADEIHGHGYDRKPKIPAGGPVSVSITTGAPGSASFSQVPTISASAIRR